MRDNTAEITVTSFNLHSKIMQDRIERGKVHLSAKILTPQAMEPFCFHIVAQKKKMSRKKKHVV
jgi:hypothetical protein